MRPLLSRWILTRPESLRRAALGAAMGAVRGPLPLPVAMDVTAAGPATAPTTMARVQGAPRSAGATSRRVRLRVDPCDQQRALISGRLGDVCDALDDLIRAQQA